MFDRVSTGLVPDRMAESIDTSSVAGKQGLVSRLVPKARSEVYRASVIVALLLFLLVAVFQRTLSFVPANEDDVEKLSLAVKTANPLTFLWGDCSPVPGGSDCEFRPLHLFSIWLVYHVFGVSAYPNQLLNIVLHLIVICLLLRLLKKEQSDDSMVFLLGALAMVSAYTVSSASWVSDRNTLIVAICLLILLDRFREASVKPWHVLALSILALLSKESGLIVPAFTLFAGFRNRRLVLMSVVIISTYFGFRFFLFGADTLAYGDGGYVLGREYSNLFELSPGMQVVANIEAVIKNIVATVVPVFNQSGGLDPEPSGVSYRNVAIWIPTLVLFICAAIGKLTRMQKWAILIVFLNAFIHFKVFRYRIEYLGLLGFCLFVAASASLVNERKMVCVKISAAILLLGNIAWVNNYLEKQWWLRYTELNVNQLSTIIAKDQERIDEGVVHQILERYKRPDPVNGK